MALRKSDVQKLRETLAVGTVLKLIKRNGKRIYDHINNQGFSVGKHHEDSIDFYSPFDMLTYGEILFDHFDLCSISKTHIQLDDCIIAIMKRSKI